MDLELITQFVVNEALVLIPVLLILGALIKRTPKVPDWTIPWILLGFGVGLSMTIMGVTPEAGIQGVLVTGTAVFGHQLYKQTKNQE